eukprot:31048-Pelagococcus_subviridis.AAC.2
MIDANVCASVSASDSFACSILKASRINDAFFCLAASSLSTLRSCAWSASPLRSSRRPSSRLTRDSYRMAREPVRNEVCASARATRADTACTVPSSTVQEDLRGELLFRDKTSLVFVALSRAVTLVVAAAAAETATAFERCSHAGLVLISARSSVSSGLATRREHRRFRAAPA